ncbi:MAG: hypothetical protein AAB673_00315 [Patescibacteria group bacterium]
MGKFKTGFTPPTIDLKWLRYLVESARELQARNTANRKEVCEALDGTSANDLRDWENEEAANLIIAQIPARAEFEAKHEGHHASIMSFKGKDVNFKFCDPGWLTGPVKLVYEFCEKAGLEPTLEYWEYWPDRDGPAKSGFHLVIHW